MCDPLVKTNPGSVVEFRCDEDQNFLQLFVAYAVSIHGFKMGCRLIIVIDPSHLSGPYKDALFSASSYDADDGLFSSKNYED